jgi:arsenate reductase (glutaredoxin)
MLEAQVFGTKNSNDTKKALRFFKERRIKVHFVDLDQRPAAPGELRRFGQKCGWGALLNIKPAPATLSEGHVLPMLERNPKWLSTPLVRIGNELAIGWDESKWRAVLKAAGQG